MFNARGPYKVIEAKKWVNSKSGATASIRGAVPWTTPAEKSNWDVQVTGYTIQASTGEVGMGHPPFDSKEEAQALAERFNS